MRGHFRYLRFKIFPMTPRTPQCEVFFPLLSSSEHSGVPEDSNSQLFQVLGFTPTLGQSGVATTRSAPFSCWDKPRATLDSLDSPRPGLGGNHHLPPYSILCSSSWRLHPNGSFSQDSQVGVPKLSRNCPETVLVGVSGLWDLITPNCRVRLRRGLNQSCSSP
jgi:hypothetical protein